MNYCSTNNNIQTNKERATAISLKSCMKAICKLARPIIYVLTPKNGRSGLTRLDRPIPRLDRPIPRLDRPSQSP
jgi:hypothetical protein